MICGAEALVKGVVSRDEYCSVLSASALMFFLQGNDFKRSS
jgi:hypothetical protein